MSKLLDRIGGGMKAAGGMKLGVAVNVVGT